MKVNLQEFLNFKKVNLDVEVIFELFKTIRKHYISREKKIVTIFNMGFLNFCK